jgi:DNA-binding MarR family transcriptional regulator
MKLSRLFLRYSLFAALWIFPGAAGAEIVLTLRVSPLTVTRDLRVLCQEGFVEKVEPNRSPRTHYFQLRSLPGAAPGS